MTAPASVQTDPTQQPPDGLSDAEQSALAALTTFFAEASLVTSVALPPYLYAQLLRLGFDKRAVRSAFRLAAGLPLGRRQGRSPQAKRRSARRPGTAAAQVAAEEPEWRARYLLAAARRITDRIQAGKTPAQAVRDEQPILDRHRDAGRRRAQAAADVDKTADHAPGGLLVWKIDPTLNNTPGCVWANNRIFTRDAPLVFSDEPGLPAKPQFPGAVHPKCGCRAEPLGGYVDLDQLAASNQQSGGPVIRIEDLAVGNTTIQQAEINADRITTGTLTLSAKTPGYSVTPHPLGPGDLWRKPGFRLPPYIQNVAKGLMESGHGRSRAIAMAIGVIRRWAAGGGNVHPEVRAASAKAIAEWEALKARAKSVKSVKASNTGAPMTDRTSGKVSDFPRHAFLQFASEPLALASSWDGSKHPRGKKGSPDGGRFVAGKARDDNAAVAQKDGKAAGNYDAGMRDPKKVDEQLKGMNDADLQALTRYAYSFKSSDPKVVALRFKLAGALKSRGQDVNDFGGLGKSGGKKSATGRSAPAPAKSTRKQVVKKTTRTSTAAGLSQAGGSDGLALAGRHRAGGPYRFRHGWIPVEGGGDAKPAAPGNSKVNRPAVSQADMDKIRHHLAELKKLNPEAAEHQRKYLNEQHREGKLTPLQARAAIDRLNRLRGESRSQYIPKHDDLVDFDLKNVKSMDRTRERKRVAATRLSFDRTPFNNGRMEATVGAVALAQASAPAGKQGRWTDEQRRQMADKKIALADGSFPIPDRAHLAKAQKAKGRAAPGKRPLVEAHIRRRARALGVNPDDC